MQDTKDLTFQPFFREYRRAYSQQKTITGKVTSSDGEILPGTSISVAGSSLVTATGKDGTYKINVPAGFSSLTFSNTGYTPQDYNGVDMHL